MQKEMRFLATSGNSPLSDVVQKAMKDGGMLSIAGLRKPGIKLLEETESEFRALAPLQDKAQAVIDKAVVEVGLQRLTFVADLLSRGLTYNLTDPLGVTQLEWNSMNKVGAAQRTMRPDARGENKMPILLPNRLPIYLTTDNFELDIRTLKMSQRIGTPLDTTLVAQCTRSVNEAIEDAAINGATTLDGQDLQVAGYKAPGILNAPNAETKNLTAAAWTSSPVGATVFNELMSMIGMLQTNKKFGPYVLYVPTVVGNALDSDWATTNSQGLTIRQRLLQIASLTDIKVADMMPAGNGASPSIGAKVALVQMTKDVVDIIVGQPPTVIPWTSLNGFIIYNLVMAIMIPRVRSDYNGDSGIAIGTTV